MKKIKPLKVMLLVHETLIPPEDLEDYDDPRMPKYQTEFDVKSSLLALGHSVLVVGAYDDLSTIQDNINNWQPHIVFNLLEEFQGIGAFDYHVVSFLEMINMPYTGCNPRGLVLSRDKALSKVLLKHHHINVPDFYVFKRGQNIRKNVSRSYPLIVKSLMIEGSTGISQASYVKNEAELIKRVRFLQEKSNDDVIAEQYIDGRELYITIIGNTQLTVFPFREIRFTKKHAANNKPLATYTVKWNSNYREKWGIDYQFARKLPNGLQKKLVKICKNACKILDLNGYARFDIRINQSGQAFVLEANPNPAIAINEDSAYAAKKGGFEYNALIQRILTLGLNAHKKKMKRFAP